MGIISFSAYSVKKQFLTLTAGLQQEFGQCFPSRTAAFVPRDRSDMRAKPQRQPVSIQAQILFFSFTLRTGKDLDQIYAKNMPAFISHSFENKPEFENITDALELAQVAYWNSGDAKAGLSLRDRLRQAVAHCNVCIFVATHKAVEWSWCGSELGAFWGAGKPITVYLADSSLSEENLPRIVRGDLWERKIARVVARVKELVNEVSAPTDARKIESTHVGNMTIEQLERLIQDAVALAAANAKDESHAATAEEIGQFAKGAAG